MKLAKNIMVQGTASSVGKSVITAALCRIFMQEGYKVAPFKSQNMALNSFVTKEGLEMGRAQVIQAEAAGVEPEVAMNPILLKPTTDKDAQVIVNGIIYKNLDAKDYHDYKLKAKGIVSEAYQKLASKNDIIVIEGAGSPAEINLREKDIVNMGMAEIADAPVVLVADIDKGGVFASIVGTMFLLTEEEKKRVKGVIINKFRGDIELLNPGIKMLEDIIKIPVLGVIPYMKIHLEDEDSVTEKFYNKEEKRDVEVAVINLPYMSNYTDFDVFKMFSDVSLNYINSINEIHDPDIIIIPGSKNTIADLKYIKESGFSKEIFKLNEQGKLIIGICGGYQVLGKKIEDPTGVESNDLSCDGLGLLNIKTVLQTDKTLTQVKAKINSETEFLNGLKGEIVEGYEIHMGQTSGEDEYEKLTINTIRSQPGTGGVVANNIIGTYLHGVFDSTKFTRGLINNVRQKKGLTPIEISSDYAEFKQAEYNKLASIVRENISLEKIKKIINNESVFCDAFNN